MEKIYVIYSYDFGESVYVGLSKNLASRHRNRKNDSSDTVNKFCKEHSFELPEPKILESSLTSIEAQSKELNWIQYYVSLGKEIINKNPCGVFISSVGGNTGIKNEPSVIIKDKLTKTKQRQLETTYEKCYNIAKEYKYKSDFQKEHGYEYRFSKKMGWLSQFDWLGNKKSVKNSLPLTYENYLQVVKSYTTKSDFCKGCKVFYMLGLKEGWNDIFFPKTVKVKTAMRYSNIKLDDILDELKTYKNRSELNKKNHGLYECCRKNKWLEVVYPRKRGQYPEQNYDVPEEDGDLTSLDLTSMVSSEKYPSYYINPTKGYVYHKLKTTIHKLKPRNTQMGYITYCIKENNKYTDILYHNLLGEFLEKESDAVVYKNSNLNDVSYENLEFVEINQEDILPIPQYPFLFLNKRGTIYDSILKVIYYGTKLTDEGWFYKSINLGKLCFSLFKSDIQNNKGKIVYQNGNVQDYSINNLSFKYGDIADMINLRTHNGATEFIITLNQGDNITLCQLSDKLTCSKLYEDLKERIKNNSSIEQWIYDFMENVLPLYINENQVRNNLKKRTESNGCYWWNPRKKWKSKIFINDKEYTLGYFDSFECGKYIYEMAVLAFKYDKFTEWYSNIDTHRDTVKNMFFKV